MREMFARGDLEPGARLPPEGDLADLLGASRNIVRAAVPALVTVHVLDVRRGDGTYMTSLRPELSAPSTCPLPASRARGRR
jgi:GntR family transcriptional repressor for pyruvate dehydrogenase complex